MGLAKRGGKWLVAFATLLVACSSSSAGNSNGAANNGGCADGFSPSSDGDGCTEVLPASDCVAGTRAQLGSATCAPIANFACPAGFVVDPSGWGCHDVSPAADCAVGTIEELGNATCQPIDDCTAAFPPAGATFFVDDSTVTEDATHFKTIDGAIGHATSGAIIAVEAGTYVEGVETHVPLSIVGRCASQVIVNTPGGMLAGFQAINVTTGPVAISGMSFNGFRGGVVEENGDVTVTDVDIRGSQQSGIVAIGGKLHVVHVRSSGAIENTNMGFGAFLSDSADVDMERVVLAKNPLAGLAVNSKATVKISQSISRDNGLDAEGKAGAGVAISEGAQATIDTCAILANHSSSVEGYDADTKITITNSVLRDVLADNFGNHGDGIAMDDTGTVDVSNTTVSGSAENGLLVIGVGTSATVSNTVFVGNGASPQHGVGVSAGASATLSGVVVADARDYGLLAQDSGSTLTVSGTLVRDIVRTKASEPADGNGVECSYGATLTMTDSTIYNAVQVGLGIGGTDTTGTGGTATITKVLIAHSVANENGDFGRAVQITDGATLTANGSAFLDNQETGLCIGQTASANIAQSLVRGTGTIGATKFGYGIVVLTGSSMALESSAIRDNSAIGLAFSGSAASVDNVVVAHNAIGIFASDTTLDDVTSPPSNMTPQQIFVSQTRFDDNATRVSSDDIPLPQVIQ